jgi:hypothetical protein
LATVWCFGDFSPETVRAVDMSRNREAIRNRNWFVSGL